MSEENATAIPPSTYDKVNSWFTHHIPTEKSVEHMADIRDAGKDLAYLIAHYVPAGADQMDAIRKVREAVMTANAGIACDSR